MPRKIGTSPSNDDGERDDDHDDLGRLRAARRHRAASAARHRETASALSGSAIVERLQHAAVVGQRDHRPDDAGDGQQRVRPSQAASRPIDRNIRPDCVIAPANTWNLPQKPSSGGIPASETRSTVTRHRQQSGHDRSRGRQGPRCCRPSRDGPPETQSPRGRCPSWRSRRLKRRTPPQSD